MEFDWIFFDCFNTLIDDFDEEGDETGIKPLAQIPVQAGIFPTEKAFYKAYLDWRLSYWNGAHWKELHLQKRLTEVLIKSGNTSKEKAAKVSSEMLTLFFKVFPNEVRLAPGVKAMLNKIQGKVRAAVVSNFFIPGYPETMLKKFGLDQYFELILDSAQFGIKKPGVSLYHHAAKRLSLDQSAYRRILFVGDNLTNDVLKPLELGMQAIHFDRSAERGGPATPTDFVSIRSWSEFTIP
jgi:putative hydrolase of the HAD superfamily